MKIINKQMRVQNLKKRAFIMHVFTFKSFKKHQKDIIPSYFLSYIHTLYVCMKMYKIILNFVGILIVHRMD